MHTSSTSLHTLSHPTYTDQTQLPPPRNLEKQVESGSMKLADEKRALQEISQTKRSRKTVEGFQAEMDSIDADKAKADELRKQLDDPESKAVSERYDAIKAELDEMKKESDEVFASRNKLFDERNALQTQLDTLYNQKRDSAQRYRDANDKYWTKVNEDRAKRAERARAQRAAEEEEKKKELATRLREEAEEPAFQVQIEDCQTLIDYFSGNKPSIASGVSSLAKSLEDEPKLDIRKVEEGPGDGLVLRKKKGADEESYFVGGKGKKGGKKGGPKAVSGSTTPEPTAVAAAAAATNVNVPLATLSALLSLSIPPPANSTDIPRVVEDLKTKKAWFEANQARVTAEAVAKAEADIKRLTQGKMGGAAATLAAEPPNGDGEKPAEPAPTPAVADSISTSLPEEAVDEKLEQVQEQEAEA